MTRPNRPVIGIMTAHLLDLRTEQWLGSVDAAAANDCDLICFIGRELQSPVGFRSQANAIYDLVTASRIDALVIWASTLELYVGHEEMTRFCERFAAIPIVSVERDLGSSATVAMDDERGMHEAVSHLIDVHGLRDIGFVRGPSTHLGAEQRLNGYLGALSDHGLPVDRSLISPPCADWTPELAANFVRSLLDDAGGSRIQGIGTANDDLALGVLSELYSGTPVRHRDIAVVGFDGFINARSHDLGFVGSANEDAGAVPRAVNVSTSTLSLTTVRAPFYAMGRRAVELALARVRGEPVPPLVTLPTELGVGRSCGCIPTDGEPGDAVPDATSMPADRTPSLQRAYAAELRGEGDGTFLALLDGYVGSSMRAGAGIESWWPAMFALRRSSRDAMTDPAVLARAEELWLQIELLLHESFQRFWRFSEMLSEKRNQIIHELGQRLITAPDVAGLAAALAKELPRLGIPSCYVAGYETAPPSGDHGDTTPVAARTWSRAMLTYENGKTIDLAPEELVFRSTELVPGARLDRRPRFSLVAAPLYFKEQQLGFVLFELGPRIGWIYEALQELVSSALQEALLVQREREAAMAIQDARARVESALIDRARLLHRSTEKNELLEQEILQRQRAEAALQTAHAELEQRVRDRTAELARANDVLTEQITERERAELRQAALEAQLRHAQKMEAIGRLAGGIAHDFNNLLVVINGNTDMLLKVLPVDDPMRQDVTDIQYAGERAANLTRQLLAFSRQQVLRPERIDLNKVINAINAMLQRLIGEHVTLTTELTDDVPQVWADSGQVEQIIFNLAVNARDAMPQGGTLKLETASETLDADDARGIVGLDAGDYVVLRISDTGTGMEESVQARIFEPFFTTKPTGAGTGLGLATVFGIVQQSGGHVRVTSALGQGTTFEVLLPQAEPSQETKGSETPGTARAEGAETLLLVEDDVGVRNVARRALSSYGYQVLEAGNGVEALDVWTEREGKIDLVVTDVVMPEMGGEEFIARLAELNATPPVLFMSGYTDDSAERAGAAEVSGSLLHKPFTASALAEKVREVLDRAS